MAKVAVVTDTICCLPADLVKEYDIQVVPVGLVIDRTVYPDDSLTNEKFWELFYGAREPVTTVAITPGDFERVFSQLGQTTDNIVCILVSKALSATYQSASIAKDLVKDENPNLNIEIVDSVSAAGAEGFIVLEAAKAAREGKNLTEVVEAARNMIPRANFFTALDTLKYLIRSGRAPKIAVLGDMMKVKPIVSINKENGMVENVAKTRGRQKAMEKMVDMVKDKTDASRPVHLMVHYTDGIAAGEELKRLAMSRLNIGEIFMTPYTPVMASQTGPVLSISYYQ